MSDKSRSTRLKLRQDMLAWVDKIESSPGEKCTDDENDEFMSLIRRYLEVSDKSPGEVFLQFLSVVDEDGKDALLTALAEVQEAEAES